MQAPKVLSVSSQRKCVGVITKQVRQMDVDVYGVACVRSFWRRLRALAHGTHLLATKYGMVARVTSVAHFPLSANSNWDPRLMGNTCVHRSGTKVPTEFILARMILIQPSGMHVD